MKSYSVVIYWYTVDLLYSDLHSKYPQQMHVVYQDMQPYLSAQSLDMFHDHLPTVTLREDLVSFFNSRHALLIPFNRSL